MYDTDDALYSINMPTDINVDRFGAQLYIQLLICYIQITHSRS